MAGLLGSFIYCQSTFILLHKPVDRSSIYWSQCINPSKILWDIFIRVHPRLEWKLRMKPKVQISTLINPIYVVTHFEIRVIVKTKITTGCIQKSF